MKSTWISLTVWIVGTSLAAISGAVTAKEAARFYGLLEKPKWAPPAWLFGPAWTVLYIVMAVAAWRIWREHGFDGARGELILYFIQLLLNAAWSWFFFVKHTGLGATIEVSFMLTAVFATMTAFALRDPIAGLLFVPYAMWVSFATALTVSVWRRNPTLL
jgi:tryptophan-rich sensory protein